MTLTLIWSLFLGMSTCHWAPHPYEAIYDVLEDGKSRGTATAILTRDRDRWHYQLETHARRGVVSGTLIESSEFHYNGEFEPVSFRSKTSVALFSRKESVDFGPNSASGIYKGDQWKLALNGNEVDRLTINLVIGRFLACQGPDFQPMGFSMPVVEKGRLRTYALESGPEETISTGAGAVAAIPVTRDRGKRKTTSYFAPSRNFMPVLIEHEDDGDLRRLVLKELPIPPGH